jgi:hypothetical protein
MNKKRNLMEVFSWLEIIEQKKIKIKNKNFGFGVKKRVTRTESVGLMTKSRSSPRESKLSTKRGIKTQV